MEGTFNLLREMLTEKEITLKSKIKKNINLLWILCFIHDLRKYLATIEKSNGTNKTKTFDKKRNPFKMFKFKWMLQIDHKFTCNFRGYNSFFKY